MQPCEDGRACLVNAIEEALGCTLSPAIRAAFLRVSRAHFVPNYFKQVQPGEWISFPTEGSVYQDRPFTTKVNAKMMPCSSSSQPSIMAAMLEALDLFPGAQVLEIGTGTGYNAALLAEIVGKQGRVTSIDIDSDLVQDASQRLKETGYTNVHVLQGDALEALPSGQFDRVILTGGYPSIIPLWIHCLITSGKLVGNLLGTLAMPLFCLTKCEHEVSGSLLPVPGFFMSLYPQSDEEKNTIAPGARISLSPYLAMPLIEVGRTTTFVEALDDLSFKLFLDTHLPGIQMRPHYIGRSPTQKDSFATCLVYAQSLAMFSPVDDAYTVEVRGLFPLWSRLQDLYSQWIALGSPSLHHYTILLDQAKGCTTILLTSLDQE